MRWNQRELDQFWGFINERQNVWHRRHVLQIKPPWTTDPLLRTGFYTNVYRQLDPGSVWMVENILDLEELSYADKAFLCLLYRFCGSNYRVWDSVPLGPVRHFSAEDTAAILEKAKDPWGKAYITFPMTNEKTGLSKVHQVLKAFEELAGYWDRVWKTVDSAPSADAAFRYLHGCRMGIGPFTAYQAFLDYLYPNANDDQLLQWSRDDFVIAGPGAQRGLEALSGVPRGGNRKEQEARMRWLHEHQVQEFKRLGIKFHWLRKDGQAVRLWLSDTQSTLCEFSKFVRARDTGRILRRYQPKGGVTA